MMARDYRGDGDDLIAKQNELNAAHAKKLAAMWQIAEETRAILQEEMRRFQRWLPEEMRPAEQGRARQTIPPQNVVTDVQGQPMPRVVRQGPAKEVG